MKKIIIKRHLSPDPLEIKSVDDVFMLSSIPDIIWLIQDDVWTDIYKGIIIISSKKPVGVDLFEKKVDFLS